MHDCSRWLQLQIYDIQTHYVIITDDFEIEFISRETTEADYANGMLMLHH